MRVSDRQTELETDRVRDRQSERQTDRQREIERGDEPTCLISRERKRERVSNRANE